MLFITKQVFYWCFRPTGGSDKWTATACDCLSLYLTGAVATIILQVCSGVSNYNRHVMTILLMFSRLRY